MNGISNANRQQASFGAIKLKINAATATRFENSANPTIKTLARILHTTAKRLPHSTHADAFVLTGVKDQGVHFATNGKGNTIGERRFLLELKRAGELLPREVLVAFENTPLTHFKLSPAINVAHSAHKLQTMLEKIALEEPRTLSNLAKPALQTLRNFGAGIADSARNLSSKLELPSFSFNFFGRN